MPETDTKAVYVQQKFGEIAEKYDLFNDLITMGMHRWWKRFMVRQTGIGRNATCLDLCCGTGDIAQYLLNEAPDGQVYGMDFSSAMLFHASQRYKTGTAHPQLLQGDAMKLPFADNRFDAVTVGFGLRNVSNLSGALKEILRVLKPGGVLVSLDVGKVNVPLIKQIFHWFFFNIVPRIGKWLMPGQEMFDYLPHSAIEYPGQEQLKRLMLGLGFKQVDVHNFMFGSSTIHVAYKSSSEQ
ncbi:MAG: bifunctional demethylmenaquinone methyltransferase/2-methoxy-6-polyprenyl-1,4-benzoquinol methylase UbiE [SAR324 cluster bacterium]|nr:bifunctional demethylmenaquinone methyltransferase/2-methoxy-6-polyprenyl-1,4-benzoquinol methylase UbiE [SAR324 cluster bacterium]